MIGHASFLKSSSANCDQCYPDSQFQSTMTGGHYRQLDSNTTALEVDWRDSTDLKNEIVALISEAEPDDETCSLINDMTNRIISRKRGTPDQINEALGLEMQSCQTSIETSPPIFPHDSVANFSNREVNSVATSDPEIKRISDDVVRAEDTVTVDESLIKKGKFSKRARTSSSRLPRSYKPDAILWEEWFSALRCYGQSLGHCNVSRTCKISRHDGREMKIGEWLHTQRSNKRDGTLTAERVAAMQQLVDEGRLAWSLHWNAVPSGGIGMTPNDLRWEGRYQELLQYGAMHGEYNVPYQRSDNLKPKKRAPVPSSTSSSSSGCLGGQGEYLTLDVHPAHTAEGSRGAVLYQGKAAAKMAALSKEQIPLGKWLKKQRQHRQDGAIRSDREAKLQALADLGEGKFKWSSNVSRVNVHDDKKWTANMDMLVAFGQHRGGGAGCCDMHTKTSVINGATGEPKHLGLWIKRQKRQYLRGLLRAERVERLQQLVDQGLLTWTFPEPYKKGEYQPGTPVLVTAPFSSSAPPLDFASPFTPYLEHIASIETMSREGSSSRSLSHTGHSQQQGQPLQPIPTQSHGCCHSMSALRGAGHGNIPMPAHMSLGDHDIRKDDKEESDDGEGSDDDENDSGDDDDYNAVLEGV